MLPYKERWYKDAIVYGIDIGSFQDGDGDGIGDFQGLIRRLDYIADLGVNCVWLMPFFPSPERDNGYDVADYYGVQPSHGTLGDLVEFVQRARDRGIRVLIDLVFNHTSDQHRWFQNARRHPESPFRDFYVWSDEPAPPLPGKGPIFQGQEDSVWSYDEESKSWYYHRFYSFEPGLNLSNQSVREEMFRILGFWLQCGAAGFRIDAASHMVEDKGKPGEVIKGSHAILKELRSVVQDRGKGALLVGEADEDAAQLGSFFGEGDELHALLNFLLCNYLFLALARGEAEPVVTVLKLLPEVPHECHWLNFLRNLDELDLERLTETQRDEVFKAFAPKPDMRIFGRGIRRRLAPMLKGDRARLKLAYSLLFSMPGSPVLVYDDEIGMGDMLSLKGRSAVRTAMQWSAEDHGSFTTGKPRAPVIEEGPFSFRKVNVAAQAGDPDSLLRWIRSLTRLRRRFSEIGFCSPDVIETGEAAVLALRYTGGGEEITTIHNLADSAVTVCVSDLAGQRMLLSSWRKEEDDPAAEGQVKLEPYGTRWIAPAPQPLDVRSSRA